MHPVETISALIKKAATEERARELAQYRLSRLLRRMAASATLSEAAILHESSIRQSKLKADLRRRGTRSFT